CSRLAVADAGGSTTEFAALEAEQRWRLTRLFAGRMATVSRGRESVCPCKRSTGCLRALRGRQEEAPSEDGLAWAGSSLLPVPRTLGAGTCAAALAHLTCIGGGSPPR